MIFSGLFDRIRQVFSRMLPVRSVEMAEHVESPLTSEMQSALELWHDMYVDKAPWLSDESVKSMGLAPFICSEIARQVVLEAKWNITGKASGDPSVEAPDNARAEYLRREFGRLMRNIREKLEQGCAAGGMIIKPIPGENGRIYFDINLDWEFFPISFDSDHNLQDVIFREQYQDGRITYTRLERHEIEGSNVKITQRAFKSYDVNALGTEISLKDVPKWAELTPETVVQNTDGQLFGWYQVASANNVDINSPMGVSVFHRATEAIKQADIQYSRILWEYEGTELAIHVTPDVFMERDDGKGGKIRDVSHLNRRLYRAIDMADEDFYQVFSPAIRDSSLFAGLNRYLMQVEDLCGLARGTISDANVEARTATELKIIRNRTFTTISDNQKALEYCLRDVIRAMDKYADIYKLAPPGEIEVSFEWDDSVINDTSVQLQERLELLAQRIMSREEIREWYLGETHAQAVAAIKAQDEAAMQQQLAMMQQQAAAMGGNPGEEDEPIPGQEVEE